MNHINKLNLNLAVVEKARTSAKRIALAVQTFIDKHTTTTIERTICRLLGIDGVDEYGIPLPNIIVNHLKENNLLQNGIALYLGNAVVDLGFSPQDLAQELAIGKLNLTQIPMHESSKIKSVIYELASDTLKRIMRNPLW